MRKNNGVVDSNGKVSERSARKDDSVSARKKVVNLLGHPVDYYSKCGKKHICTYEPSGIEARCFTRTILIGHTKEGVPIERVIQEGTTDLPGEKFGRVFIVSHRVRGAFPKRKDLISPTEILWRDGKKVGCRKFVSN